MAKCDRCGKSLFMKKSFQLKDAVVCQKCADDMELYKYIGLDYYSYHDVKDGYEAYKQLKEKKSSAQKQYFFLVHDLDEDFIEKYRKQNIDKEDRYEGMTFNDIRANCYEGDKIYKYPEMEIYLDFRLTTIDDAPAMEVYLDDHMVGYVPKTKVKRTKQLLIDNVSWKAELYGGDYRILKGTYVDEWFDKVNIRVTFTWIEENA